MLLLVVATGLVLYVYDFLRQELRTLAVLGGLGLGDRVQVRRAVRRGVAVRKRALAPAAVSCAEALEVQNRSGYRRAKVLRWLAVPAAGVAVWAASTERGVLAAYLVFAVVYLGIGVPSAWRTRAENLGAALEANRALL